MNTLRPAPWKRWLVPAALAGLPAPALACATCFGKSDSAMAKAMNAGIFTLLVCILSVLFAISLFFFYILRRAARGAAASGGASLPAAPVSQPPQ